jgi:ferredoxin-NADP reductase
MRVTLPINEVLAATPRAVVLRLGLDRLSFDYRSGQAVLVGSTGQLLKRPYSIAIAPHESRALSVLELLVGLDAGGSPGSHLPVLTRGTPVEVEGPIGSFQLPLQPHARRFLFLAGGTGIAPLRAMLHEALWTHPHARFDVLYSARSPDEFAYGDELAALAAQGRIALLQTVTRPGERPWTGERGRITSEHVADMVDADALCFVCGPHTFVEAMLPLLGGAGVAADRIRVEDWGTG